MNQLLTLFNYICCDKTKKEINQLIELPGGYGKILSLIKVRQIGTRSPTVMATPAN